MIDDQIDQILSRGKSVEDVTQSSTTSPISNSNNLNINVQAQNSILLYCCMFLCICLTVLALVFF